VHTCLHVNTNVATPATPCRPCGEPLHSHSHRQARNPHRLLLDPEFRSAHALAQTKVANPSSSRSNRSARIYPSCRSIIPLPTQPFRRPQSADRNRPSKTQPDSIRLNQTTRFFSRSAPNPQSAFPDPKNGVTSEKWKERRGDPNREMVHWPTRRHTGITSANWASEPARRITPPSPWP
jgi:hypothetical protein